MDFVTRQYLIARQLVTGHVAGAFDGLRNDRGQASTEYAGVLFVIVAIIAAVIAVGFSGIGSAIVGKIADAVSKVGS